MKIDTLKHLIKKAFIKEVQVWMAIRQGLARDDDDQIIPILSEGSIRLLENLGMNLQLRNGALNGFFN